MNQRQLKWESKVGPIYLVASAEGLHAVFWRRANIPEAKEGEYASLYQEVIRQLEEYLDGRRREFELPLRVGGTEFQRRVWNELNKIPFGETRSYRDIASALGDPKACRAVGTANGRNPLSLIVPCHRVIAADGTLGGYGGGLAVKRRLLELEGQRIPERR